MNMLLRVLRFTGLVLATLLGVCVYGFVVIAIPVGIFGCLAAVGAPLSVCSVAAAVTFFFVAAVAPTAFD